MSMSTCRIYVACLASYTAGHLFGQWVDIDGLDADDIGEAVQAMLDRSPIPHAEEYAIHDHEGFPVGSVGEYTSLNEIAELGEAIDTYGDAFIAALSNFLGSNQVESALDYLDNYMGVYESLADYEQRKADEYGLLENVPAWLEYHIDWESVARDGGACGFRVGGNLHVFCQ